jgi:3' exoribonuclease, RNase T-like
MKYALDTEFIDTPTCSTLISLALVAEDERSLYLEFDYPQDEISPWLQLHVVPLLTGKHVTFEQAARSIRRFVGGGKSDRPEFWAYYAAHDWYWFCRVFGGIMELPEHYPHLCKDFAYLQQRVPNLYGPEHHALNDALSLMAAMKLKNVARAT